MSFQVYVIPQMGEPYRTVIPSGDSLHALQELVQGYIEVAPRGVLNHRYLVLVNEEGLFRSDFVLNGIASAVCMTRIVGPAVVVGLGVVDGEPDWVGLTDAQVRYLDNLLRE